MLPIEIIPNWHPLVVHFTIALPLVALALFLAGTAVSAGRPGIAAALTAAARLNLGLGLAAALVALATGWYAYGTVAHDEPGHTNMTRHMYWAIGTSIAFSAAALLAWLDRRRPTGGSLALLAVLVLGSGALAVTGWLGGENVYRHGLGVMRLPNMAEHQHTPGQSDHNEGDMASHGHNAAADQPSQGGVGAATMPPPAGAEGGHRHD